MSSAWWLVSCTSRCEHIRAPVSRRLSYRAFCWCSGLPGVKNLAHLKCHLPDGKRVALPGASIFAHLEVVGLVTERSVGVQDFQV